MEKLLSERPFGLAPPPSPAYLLCAQPPVHHTVTKKVYDPDSLLEIKGQKE